MFGNHPRDPRFKRGGSTPRPFRCNNALWREFGEIAQKYGFTPTEAMRRMMENVVAAHGSIKPAPRPSARRIARQRRELEPDIIIVEAD